MSIKKYLAKQIRGWFPQEPKFPTRSNPIQKAKINKALPRPVIRVLWSIAGYIVIFSLLFGFSMFQIVLTALVLSLGILWFISNRRIKSVTTRFLKYCLIFILTFTVIFSGVQVYVFGTSGYPPTLAPQFTHTDLTSVSLTQYLQNVEQSENFRLLQLDHFGSVTFERIQLNSYSSSALQWTFHARDTNSRISIANNAGHAYRTNIDSLKSSLFPQRALPTKDFPLQTTMEIFGQIDKVGLDWFLTYAADYYENQTGTKPEIAALIVNVGFSDTNGYDGLTVLLSARSLDHDSRGTAVYPGIFEAEFDPNGTLLSLKNRA
jgi:hypothetical protein